MPQNPSLPDAGSSLPPRKRLLAGLKQNGWLAPPPASSPAASQLSGALVEDLTLEVDLGAGTRAQEPAEPARGGECLGDSGEGTIVQAGSNADVRLDFGKSESGSKRHKSCSPAANSIAPVEEQPEMTSKPERDQSKLRRKGKGSKAVHRPNSAFHPKKEIVSQHARAAAAKLTAAMAAKTAAQAKAIAANKAATAAKAAAIAKSALEAVANEAWRPTRSSSRRHSKVGIYAQKQESRELDMTQNVRLTRVSQVSAPVDDEELARQLHRAMNSSPRISRGNTLDRRKEEGHLRSSTQTFQGRQYYGRQRSSSLKHVERKFSSQSFDIPQGHVLDVDVKSKPRTSFNENIDSPLQGAEFSGNNFSGDIASDAAVSPGRLRNGSHLKMVEQGALTNQDRVEIGSRERYMDEENGLQSSRTRDHKSASKNESVHSNNQTCFNVNVEDWTMKSNVMDVEQSVNQLVTKERAGSNRYPNRERLGRNELVNPANEMQDVNSRRNNEDAEKESAISVEPQLALTANAAGKETVKGAQDGIVECDKQVDAGNSEGNEMKLKDEAEAISFSIRSDIMEESSTQKDLNESLAVQDVSKRACSTNRSKLMSKTLVQSIHTHKEGQKFCQEILKGRRKGLSANKPTFGVDINSFRSGRAVSLRAPTFASGPTGRNS